jgi:hypothetical protein
VHGKGSFKSVAECWPWPALCREPQPSDRRSTRLPGCVAAEREYKTSIEELRQPAERSDPAATRLRQDYHADRKKAVKRSTPPRPKSTIATRKPTGCMPAHDRTEARPDIGEGYGVRHMRGD